MPARRVVVPHLSILYHRSSYVRFFSALNSIPQISAQDEAAVTSRDRPTVVVVMFFPVVYAVVSSANMEQLFETLWALTLKIRTSFNHCSKFEC